MSSGVVVFVILECMFCLWEIVEVWLEKMSFIFVLDIFDDENFFFFDFFNFLFSGWDYFSCVIWF